MSRHVGTSMGASPRERRYSIRPEAGATNEQVFDALCLARAKWAVRRGHTTRWYNSVCVLVFKRRRIQKNTRTLCGAKQSQLTSVVTGDDTS
jgi:hypothetical protein